MSIENPAVILYDSSGNAVSVVLEGGVYKLRVQATGAAASGSAISGNPILIGGSDGTNARSIKTTSDGTIRIDPIGTTTQPVSVSSLPLPSGAATETTLLTLLRESVFTTRINTFGQKTMANSTPVVLSSDQSAIPVSGAVSATQGTSPWVISAASLPLPTGAASEVTLSTLLTSSTFTGRINTFGQKLMTASTPVVIASDQTAINIDGYVVADIGDTNGLALDITVNSLLKESTFISRINTLGQKTASGSVPVVIASNQSAVPVTIVDGEAGGGVQKILYDIGANDIYIGTAAQGTASSAAAWLIKKTTLDISGNPISTLYSSDTAVWDDRLSEIYS